MHLQFAERTLAQRMPKAAIPATIALTSVRDEVQFANAGIYTVHLAITDANRHSVTADTIGNDLPAYVVIYDPDAGFVTAGGTIESPSGALASNELAHSRGIFSFSAKYTGANKAALQGHRDFAFRAEGLSFKSLSFDWLVVAGNRADLQGIGTINGTGRFAFRATAIDGDGTRSQGQDLLPIQIWDSTTRSIIFNNQKGASMTNRPDDSTAIQNGNISIHW